MKKLYNEKQKELALNFLFNFYNLLRNVTGITIKINKQDWKDGNIVDYFNIRKKQSLYD